MRMWMVNPKIMCREHLLGEHLEIHMIIGTLKLNRSVKGFADKNLLEICSLETRHDELVKEMQNRGYNHKSEWNGNWNIIQKHPQWNQIKSIKIDRESAQNDLLSRCKECMLKESQIQRGF